MLGDKHIVSLQILITGMVVFGVVEPNQKTAQGEIKMKKILSLAISGLLITGSISAFAEERDRDYRKNLREEYYRAHNSCQNLPGYDDVTHVLAAAVAEDSSGLNNDMWATVVDRDGIVCSVTRSGGDRGDQWPGSRVISAQKANTANAFSLPAGAGGLVPGLSLSTANLYAAVQPGGSLFGLQLSNPVDTKAAYGGNSRKHGLRNDPLVGKKIGGVNVFGGGLALYNENGELVGALGVSGDTSCRDHIIAWIVRDGLGLDNVPAGVSLTADDNMIQDFVDGASTGGFGHPLCGFGEEAVIPDLPIIYPTGS